MKIKLAFKSQRLLRTTLRRFLFEEDVAVSSLRKSIYDQRKFVASCNGRRLISGELRYSISAATFFQRGQSSHAKSYSLEGSTAAAPLALCLRSVSARLA